MKTAGVIVTYNRKMLLSENIKMQIKQSKRVDKLYIIDNHGSDSTYDFLLQNELFNSDWMEYITLPENTGGAGGFYYGLKIAFEDNFDFIWLMDDDGRPFNEDTWKNIYDIVKEKYNDNNMLMINSLVTVEGKRLTFGFASLNISLDKQWTFLRRKSELCNFLEGVANPFNGTVVSKETVQKIGFPNKEFFMCRDETDYFRRCDDGGVLIGTALHSIYHHPKVTNLEKRFGRLVIPIWQSQDKEFYWVRNTTYSYKNKHKLRLFVLLIGQFLGILLWQDNKYMRITQFFEAIICGINGKMGKR